GFELEATTTKSMGCHFETVYPVDLLPIRITEVISESPVLYEALKPPDDVKNIVRIRFESTNNAPIIDLSGKTVRLYLGGNSPNKAYLYDMVFPDCSRLDLIIDEGSGSRTFPAGSITPVGFEEEEALIPESNPCLAPYRLLREYFNYPSKFHFLDIKFETGQEAKTMDLLFFSRTLPPFKLTKQHFQLGCTPVVNLFSQRLNLSTRNRGENQALCEEFEYPITFAGQEGKETELHSAQMVASTIDFQSNSILLPYGTDSVENRSDQSWSLRRESSWLYDRKGRTSYFSLRDPNFQRVEPEEYFYFIKTKCFTRDLARKIVAGTKLKMKAPEKEIDEIEFVGKPSEVVDPEIGGERLWNLISTLSLNNLSLLDDGDGSALKALSNILETFDFKDEPGNKKLIKGISQLTGEKTLERFFKQGWKGWERGLEISITVDPDYYISGSAFLLGSVLNRFFPMYLPETSFCTTVIKKVHYPNGWYRWSAIKGMIPMI
ncbi:MAG: type VI secretion system baseplate subunit TssF, partial [Proteobacteria bacterium]|nr:type VI secretion system baseplate subunit TssF [Pseudomonadota bacterium]